MEAAVVEGPQSGEVCFALQLEHLHSERELDIDVLQRDAVAMLTSFEGQQDARFVLQTVCRPSPERPERGSLEIHLITTVADGGDGRPARVRVIDLWDDLCDVLSTPPLRWEFRSVSDAGELERVLNPIDASHFAEIARREAACPPTAWSTSGGVGFAGDPRQPELTRQLWSMWTFGTPSEDMRRVAFALLAQEAPVAIRVALAPTALTSAERDGIEELLMAVGPTLEGRGLSYASLHTLESLLYLRPVFDSRCVIASPAPVSHALLSAIGHAISEPTRHGDPTTTPVLSGGFAALQGGVDVEEDILANAFRTMSSGRPVPSLAPSGLERLRRILGPWEAANAFRIPVTEDDFPGLRTLEVPDLEPPVARLPRAGRRVGRLVGYGARPVLIDPEDRFRHLYISGQTGTGKSTLLLNLALQDIAAGDGVAVLDPHGDLVQALLCRVPEERIEDVVLVDPADPVAVVGVNLLEAETPVQEEYVVSELCNMFYSLFDPTKAGIIGPRFESWLRQAALLLLSNKDQPASFLDISTLFVDPAVRQHLLTDLQDPILSEFWIGEMAQTSDFHKSEILGWFRSKFEIFRTSRLVRNVVGQAKSTISFSDVLKKQKILLLNLSKGLLGEYNSALIGHIVFAKLWAAALERASMPMHERSDFFVYIDEFQNVTSNSLPNVLSEARKFRVGLTLANQFFSQVPELTRDAILGNVGSRITFRLGPKDAGPFATWLGPNVNPDDLTTLPNHLGVAALTDRGVPLDPFALRTDPPDGVIDDQHADLVRAQSRKQWARPVHELDSEFFGRWAHVPGSMNQQVLSRARSPKQAGGRALEGTRTPHSFVEEWVISRHLAREAVDRVAVHLSGGSVRDIPGSVATIRRHLGLDAAQARGLVDSAPHKSIRKVPRHVANALRYELRLMGVDLLIDPPVIRSTDDSSCKADEKPVDLLHEPIDELNLSDRAANCLSRAGLKSVSHLIGRTKEDLLAIPKFGPKSLLEVQGVLHARGLTLLQPRTDSRIAMDEDWLSRLGLQKLSPGDKSQLMVAAYKELEHRVGIVISSRMNAEELAQFGAAKRDSDEAARALIAQTVPHHSEIVAEAFADLSNELRDAGPAILRELE